MILLARAMAALVAMLRICETDARIRLFRGVLMDSEIVELRRKADGLGRNAPAMFAGAVRPVLALVSGLLDVVERQGQEIESLKSERAGNGDG